MSVIPGKGFNIGKKNLVLIRKKLYIQVNACAMQGPPLCSFFVRSTFDLMCWIEMLDFSLIEGQPAETAMFCIFNRTFSVQWP